MYNSFITEHVVHLFDPFQTLRYYLSISILHLDVAAPMLLYLDTSTLFHLSSIVRWFCSCRYTVYYTYYC